MFRRDLSDKTLSTLMRLLLNTQLNLLDIQACIGRLLSAVVTTVGPELQMALQDGHVQASEHISEKYYCYDGICD